MTNKITTPSDASSHHIIEGLAERLLRGEALQRAVTTSDGTARRKGGKATAIKILGAALTVLLDEKAEQLSLRAVADKAGVKLANVQYYYGNRDELLNALFSLVGEAYRQAYVDAMVNAPPSPTEQLIRALKIQISDARQQTTRKFFLRLWLLLEQMSGFNGEGLRRLYRFDTEVLQDLIQQATPNMTSAQASLKATIIAAMIEGSLVVAPTGDADDTATAADFEAEMLRSCLQIAVLQDPST